MSNILDVHPKHAVSYLRSVGHKFSKPFVRYVSALTRHALHTGEYDPDTYQRKKSMIDHMANPLTSIAKKKQTMTSGHGMQSGGGFWSFLKKVWHGIKKGLNWAAPVLRPIANSIGEKIFKVPGLGDAAFNLIADKPNDEALPPAVQEHEVRAAADPAHGATQMLASAPSAPAAGISKAL